MAKYEKPTDTVNEVWARDALSTDFYQPSDDEIRIGWEQEKPPYQVENWSMNKLHLMVAYLNQLGIPEWDRRTEYQQDKSFVQASDGRIYICRATNRDRNPAEGSNPDYWEQFRGDRPASMEREGVTRYATPAEVDAGSRDDIAVTPYSLNVGRAGTPAGAIMIWPGQSLPESYLECNGQLLNVADYPDLFAVIGYTYGGSGSTFRVPDLRGEFIRGWDHGRGIDAGRILGSSQGGQIQSHNHTGYTEYDGRHSHGASTGSSGYHNHSGTANNGGWHSHTGSTNHAGNHRHNTNVLIDSGDYGSYGESVRGDGDNLPNYYHTDYSGSHNHSLNINGGGTHYHSLSINHNGSHTHSVSIASNGNHRHSFTTYNTGGGETRPRNVAMMYCIKFE